MSDYPDRINISPVFRQKREDDFYLVDRAAFPGKGKEYIRKDHAQAELKAAVAAELEACERVANAAKTRNTIYEKARRDAAEAIRARTPTDARAALEARDKRVREDALREAAAIVPNVIKSYGMMRPGKPDRYASREAQIVAKGFARLIEEDILALIDRTTEEKKGD